MPSFDVVSTIDKSELKNSLDQSRKEVGTRFDFKGIEASIEEAKDELILTCSSDMQLHQLIEILKNKLSKRGIDIRSFVFHESKPIGGDKFECKVAIKEGLDKDFAKKINACIKASKLKVSGSIQGDSLRVSGAKRDDLQKTIELLKSQITEQPLQFINFRD